MIGPAGFPSQLLFKDDRALKGITTTIASTEEKDDAFSGIRCPRCGWRPTADSRWCCDRGGTPEPFFDACGTVWNTFATGGRCPGCGHQWRWTTCLRCHECSLHEEWYEEKRGRG